MRLQSRYIVSTLLMTLMCCLSLFDVRHIDAQQDGEQYGAVVFCVTSTGSTKALMEPLLIIDGGRYFNPVAGDADASALNDFAGAYYGAGMKYRLLFGGGQVGFVTVEKPTSDTECFRTGTSIKLTAPSNLKLNRNVMALATNFAGDVRRKGLRRAPTPSERTAVIRLAKKAFMEKGTSAALLATIEVVNLTATDLDGDGNFELIGTFVVKKIKGEAARHVLFLIAEPDGQNYQATLANYERYAEKDIMSGGSLNSIGAEGIYTERLVDQIDLDADGTGEVISITNSFESVTFNMYKKREGKWKSVYEFNSYRCGF